jgi:DHA2 family multidrug resistance protein
MARNLGGSIGLALLGVFIDRRTELHADAIRYSVDANSQLVQQHIAAQAAAFAQSGGDAAYAHQQALGQLAAQIHQQAMVMTYSDCFWLLGVCLALMLPLVLVLRPQSRPPEAGMRPGASSGARAPVAAAH